MIKKFEKLSVFLLFFCLFFPVKIWANNEFLPNDRYYNKQWYLDRVNAHGEWNDSTLDNEVVVAIIDSGVQIDHPDLKDNIWTNYDEIPNNKIDDDKNGYIDDVHGWDFISNTNNPTPKLDDDFIADEVAHGTIVAGIAAAKGNNREGITGIAWNAKIMPLLVLDTKGAGVMKAVINAIDYAIKNNADIINFSFAGGVYSGEFEAAVRRAYKAGILIVAAAGNNVEGEKGRNLDYLPMYPVCNDGYYGENMILGVAATDALDQKPSFSSYGKKCVDVSAPGVSIFSSSFYSPYIKDGEELLNDYYDGYWSGTSMASPQVAGAAALVLQHNPSLERDQLFNLLLGASDYIERLNPDNLSQLGAGRLNVGRSVEMAIELLSLKKIRIANAPAGATSSTVIMSDINGANKTEINFVGNYKGDINVASGDINNDNKDEIIMGAGKNGGPQVQVFTQEGKLITQFFAFNKNFRGGVKVASGDINGDGVDDIVCSAGAGGGPHVKAFNAKGELLGQFFAFDQNFKGGVNLAVGDVNNDNVDDIITAAGAGGGPQLRIFNKSGVLINQFFAYDKSFRGGVNVAVADIDGGLRKYPEIITAPASKATSHIRVFTTDGKLLSQFYAFGEKYNGQTNISAGDTDKDGKDEIVCGAGPGGTPHVRIFEANGELREAYIGLSDDFRGGINLAVAQTN